MQDKDIAGGQRLLVGLFEWDGSIPPTIIIGTDKAAIFRKAAEACIYVNPKTGLRQLAWGSDDSSAAWLARHPFPDLTDSEACKAWVLALDEDDEMRSSTEFNIWKNPIIV